MSFYARPNNVAVDDFGPGLYAINSDAYINLEANGANPDNLVCEWDDDIASFPSAEEINAAALASSWPRIRAERNKLLTESDWQMTSDSPSDKDAWGTYRQALRDLPQTHSDGAQNDGYADDEGNWHHPASTGSITVVWPTPPA